MTEKQTLTYIEFNQILNFDSNFEFQNKTKLIEITLKTFEK